MKQIVQRNCGWPIPTGIQGQVGWVPGHPDQEPDLVVSNSADGRGLELHHH